MKQFSIIIPVYGIEKYLRKCIDSVLAQTFMNFEVILVDDGSPDSCPQICDEYAQKDNRIKVIHKENGGLISARKAGIKISTARYIVPVDGDDWASKNLLEDANRALAEFKADIFYYGYVKAYKTKFIDKKPCIMEGYYDKQRLQKEVYPNLMRNIYGKRIDGNLCGKIFKKELYEKFQLNTNDSIGIGEDESVCLPCVYFAQSMYVSHRCYYYYRQNENSMTKIRKGFAWTDIPYRVEIYEKYFDMKKYGLDEQLYRLIVHELFNWALSHLRTDKPYKETKKEILKEFSREYCQKAIKNCAFRKNIKEKLAMYAVRYRKIWWIKLYAKIFR